MRRAAVRALVFDFDGLILETEGVLVRAWEAVWSDHGHELERDLWLANLGTKDSVDLHTELEVRVGRVLDREKLRARREAVREHAFAVLGAQPGVVDYLADARAMGLSTAIASSSPSSWVEGHLARLGLVDEFVCIRCYEGEGSRWDAKPAPDLYLAAVDELGVAPQEAVAFEDSPNGIAAAKAAGLLCVAVPNDVTRDLDLSGADLIVPSLADQPLRDVLAAIC